MKQWIMKQVLPLFLSLTFLSGNVLPVYAPSGIDGAERGGFVAGGFCAHHTEHDVGCGYITGDEGSHRHTEDCYQIIRKCVHKHTGDCYPEDKGEKDIGIATPSDVKKPEPENCSHVCSEDSGCITKVLNCSYEEAEKGICTYRCLICPVQALIDALPKGEDITEDNGEQVMTLLNRIDKAREELTEEEREQLDTGRYEEAKEALEALGMGKFFLLKENQEGKLSDIIQFKAITLHYAGADGQPEGDAIQNENQDKVLIEKNKQLVLRYEFNITKQQCKDIKADIRYYLDVSPHLVLPHLEEGSPLTIETEDGEKEEFGKIYADGSRAWVMFRAKDDGSDTVLSEYGELENAYFYLNCQRASEVPKGEAPIDGKNNLYAMKFENSTELEFGYAENEPVTAEAKIGKGGELENKTITWSINYTPWQNPSGKDGITLDTPMELRDIIDTSLHQYVEDSVTIGGVSVPEYKSRDEIPQDSEAYVIAEDSDDGKGKVDTVLIFGGTRFKPGEATEGEPAQPLIITYKTSINDELLLPGGNGDKNITNAAQLFAGGNDGFNGLEIGSQKIVTVSQPTWMTKEGKTTRDSNGNGSTTDWTVTFYPNGFIFEDENRLTLHDQLPDGSTLMKNSVTVGTEKGNVVEDGKNGFTVSSIKADSGPVTVTYTTHVPEEMYDSGTSLGENTAWFSFAYNEKEFITPKVTAPVGSGDGSGKPDTSILVKTNGGYNSTERSIAWNVTINPHKVDLKSGTFTDDLGAAGGNCAIDGHTGGLELPNGIDDISVLVDDMPLSDTEKDLIQLIYNGQKITVKVEKIGAKTITLQYTTKVCDPCIFAGNSQKVFFKNTISTDDMIVGKNSDVKRSASADSTATVGATVLVKKPPIYDYSAGIMKWTVEADGAGLPMTDVILTDTLPAGLTYKEGSFSTDPAVPDAAAAADQTGQELTIRLGKITQKTVVSFDTEVNPELLGFGGDEPVVVENSIRMNGKGDGVEFAEVSHKVERTFSNHGLVKKSTVDKPQELIRYEVLINPFSLALPESPDLVDTLDKRLQLDPDTLLFYKAVLSGTTDNQGQKPGYTIQGEGQPLKVTGYDPEANCFTVRLPIPKDSRETYVLTYTADILQLQAGGYSNSVRFDGGSVLLGGSKDNSAVVGGGGGGGGGGVAARKAGIAITKSDKDTGKPLAGVAFTLYQWDSEKEERGLPFAQGITDEQGKLSFKVKPGASYLLTEKESIPGYSSAFGYERLPGGVTATDAGLLITAGEARTEQSLELTNQADKADIVFRLLNEFGVPMAGTRVRLFGIDSAGQMNPDPDDEAEVSADGTVRFYGVRRGMFYMIQRPDGGIMTVEIPFQADEMPKLQQPDGTKVSLTENTEITGTTPPDQQWELTVTKVVDGSMAPLEGAEMGLYAEETCQTLIRSETSGADGIIRFGGLMKGQTYWLKEIAAPEHYKLDSTVYKVDLTGTDVTLPSTPAAPDVDPEEPEKPGDSENPGGSGNPDTPGNSGDSGSPGDPENPGDPGLPDVPGNSGDSGNPGNPENPEGAGKPGGSGTSGGSENSGGSGTTGGSGDPGGSGDSGSSGNPEGAGNSMDSGRPGTLGSLRGPGIPVIPDNKNTPDSPNDGGNIEGRSIEDRSIPKTGDSTPWLIAAVCVSGILLVFMTLCQLFRSKKREKK